jgi:hypothetical protein
MTHELGLTIFFFVKILMVCFTEVIKGELMEEMAMFVKLPTVEGNMLVVQGLGPLLFLIV